MVAFLIGLLLPLQLPFWIAQYLLPILGLGALLLAAPGRWRPLGWLGVGVLWTCFLAADAMDRRVPQELVAADLWLEGRVVDLPEDLRGRQRFLVEPTRIESWPDGRSLPRRIRLSWYRGEAVAAGESWRWPVRLRRPRGHMNPVTFDYEQWLASAHIDALGYVVSSAKPQRLSGPSGLVAWRAAVAERIAAGEPPARGAALARALVVGDRGGFGDELWKAFRETGTSHLVAISGLHIGLVGGLTYLLAAWLWRRSPLLLRYLPAALAGSGVAFAGAAGYAAMAGFALPTQRALIMLAVVVAAQWLRRPIESARLLTLAAVAVLAVDPWAALAPGFWLSFLAVAIILAILRSASRSAFGRVVRIQLAIAVGLIPVAVCWFGEFSWIAAGVNLLAVPLFSLLLVPGVLLTTTLQQLPGVPGAELLQAVMLGLLDVTATGLVWTAEQTDALWRVGAPPRWALAIAALGAALAVAPAGAPGRRLAPALLAAVLIESGTTPDFGEAEVTFLEVGQGSAVVIRTHRHTLVYDTGPGWSSGASAALYTLLPFLDALDTERLDRLIVSHGDSDHAGGLADVLERHELAASELFSGEPLELGVATRPCQAGDDWRWDGVRFRILHPPPNAAVEGNAASCVLAIEAGAHRLLLTGDIERAQENALLDRVAGRFDIVSAPHHGSNSSSSAAFIDALRPRQVVVQAGHRNAYGLPAAAVLQRYRCHGADVLETAALGAIQYRLGGDGRPIAQAQRVRRRRIYHEPVRRFQPHEQIQYDSSGVFSGSERLRKASCGN